MRSPDFDVLIATDFRHRGGTTASIAQEVEVQARMGLKTGLVQIDSTYLPPRPWVDRIQDLVDAGLAERVAHEKPTTARLLLLRHPRVFEREGWSLAARADHVLMIANQVPADGALDRPYYDPAKVVARLAAELGASPPWAPIGPMVRDALVAAAVPGLEVEPLDWHNIIDVDAWQPDRPRVRRARGVIGRHARDDAKKWPETERDLLSAYPDAPDRPVRILGGIGATRAILRRPPRHWEVLRFGAMAPEDFLATLDVYVYFHHSGLREAFGRAPLEALASGLPVVTHPYLERVFGDACCYCETRDAPEVVRALIERRGEINQRGIDLVRERYDWETHRRRLSRYLPPRVSSVPRSTRRRRVLFVSSNGGGMGHLTRLLAIARRLSPGVEPLFLTQSTGAQAARSLGFEVDYVPSRARSGLPSRRWNAYLRRRVGAALRAWRPESIVFDGTHAYRGLLQAMDDAPHVRRVWCRRAMWKPGDREQARRSREQLAAFDLVIEPGELATSRDRGITGAQRELVRAVDPIVLLRAGEILTREASRAELGVPPGAVALLFNLGAGNINRIDIVLDAVLAAVRRRPDLHVFVLESLIARRPLAADERVTALRIYPLTRVLRAFDACVAAPGYNAFHELLACGVPTLFVPNESTLIDDQAGRAEWARDEGAALLAREADTPSLELAVDRLLDPEVRAELARRCRDLGRADGARQAADLIAALGPAERAPRRDGRLRRVSRALWSALRRQERAAAVRYTLAPADELGRGRSGVVVELAAAAPGEDTADRLRRAAYEREKRAILADVYGGEPQPW